MNLLDGLKSIRNSKYQPLYSGRIEETNKFTAKSLNEFYAKKPLPSKQPCRPQTCLTPSSRRTRAKKSPDRPITSRTEIQRSARASSRGAESSSSKARASVVFDYDRDGDMALDNESVASSTNLSLLTVRSNRTLPSRKSYGNFDYVSYFERYMNRKAVVKIPEYFMPKPPSGLDPPLFELLEPDEFEKLYNMFDEKDEKTGHYIHKRGKSLDEKDLKLRSQRNKQFKRRARLVRSASIEKLGVEKQEQTPGRHSRTTDDTQDAQSSKSDNPFVYSDSDLAASESEDAAGQKEPEFHATDLKGPSIYQMGKSVNKLLSNKQLGRRSTKARTKKAYDHIQSTLGDYLQGNQIKSNDNVKINKYQSRQGIDRHDLYSTPFVKYQAKDTKPNGQKVDKNSYLKMNSKLTSIIREDTRGPVYFGTLTQENLDMHNKFKRFGLPDRFQNVFEWLVKANEANPKDLFVHPFKNDKETLITDNEPSEMIKLEELNDFMTPRPVSSYSVKKATVESMKAIESKIHVPEFKGVLNSKNYTLDPFTNPKKADAEKVMPDKRIFQNPGHARGLFETENKQSLMVSKEFRNYLHIKKPAAVNALPPVLPNKPNQVMLNRNDNVNFKFDVKKSLKADDSQSLRSSFNMKDILEDRVDLNKMDKNELKQLREQIKASTKLSRERLNSFKNYNDILLTRINLDLYIL